MIKLIRLGVTLSILFSLILSSMPVFAASPENQPNFVPDHILVKFKPGISAASMLSINQTYGGSIIQNVSHSGVQVVKVPSGKVLDEIKAYKNDPSVEYAEPDYIVKAIGTPSDPSFNQQWGLTKIQVPEAWDVTISNTSIKIAILDTGIDQDHEDLAAKIVANKNCTQSPNMSSTVDDLYGHGTHVAGIAAAITNNGKGVAGVGYNSSLMNVKVLDDTGSGTTLSMIEGIYWAADNGAKVINMSFGRTGEASQDEEDAVNYAWSKGVVVVASAGNNGSSAPNYPAYYTNCISVAATDSNDAKPPFSTYGNWVDVAAPGLDIYSTLPNHPNTISTQLGTLNYGSLYGTSMAAPFVSGLAALVWTTPYGTNNSAVRSRIETTADPITGTGTYWQKGRINAYKAVAPSGSFSVTTNAANSISTNSAVLNGNLDGLGNASMVDVSFVWGSTFGGPYPNTTTSQSKSSPVPFSFTLSGLAPGSTYYFKAKATDGNQTVYGSEERFNTLAQPPMPLPGKIVFAYDLYGYWNIYMINPDGRYMIQLTNATTGNADPQFSPDGTQIAFTSGRDGNNEIYVMRSDGSSPTRLTNNTFKDFSPAWSPDGKKIAFVSDRDGPYQIYVMNADGSNQTRLTNNATYNMFPDWSPDGKKIVFQSDTGSYYSIYVMNADGTNLTRLTNSNANDGEPTWSPDGNRIAFISSRTGYYYSNIYVMNADGSNLKQLTSNPYYDSFPSWSPDGTKIVFASQRDNPYQLYIIDADGSNLIQLTNNLANNINPNWGLPRSTPPSVVTNPVTNLNTTSATLNGALLNQGSAATVNISFQWGTSSGNYPNETPAQSMTSTGDFDFNLTGLIQGNTYYYRAKAVGNSTFYGTEKSFVANPPTKPSGRIAYVSSGQTSDDIFIMNANGTNQTQLTTNPYADDDPSISPDGTKIAYAVETGGPNMEIFTMNADGSNKVNITNNPAFEGSPAWSPDGTKIAFTSYRDGNDEIYVMNTDGSSQTRLTNNSAIDDEPAWSSDGNKIAFVSNRDSFQSDIYVMNADGTHFIRLTNNTDSDMYPAWSPDGTKIAFTSYRNNEIAIYIMNKDGTNQTRLASGVFPAWSPDGTKIAFISTPQDIYVMAADGSSETRITSISQNYHCLSWSKGNPIAPVVMTNDPTNINTSGARLNGNLTSSGSAGAVNVSFQWDTVSRATTGSYANETTPQAMTAIGNFSASLSTLNPNTTYYFRAKAVGNGTAYGAEKSFTTSATATITLGNLNQTYDGQPKPVTYTTSPPGLMASITYNGSSTAPTSAGSYAVIATITSPGYIGSANGTLVIAKANPAITWNNPADITYGTALSAAQLNATADIPGTFSYSPPIGTILNAGNNQTLSVTFTPTDEANYNPVMKSVTINVNTPSIFISSGGGGGGGAPPPPPVIKSVTITGFSSATDLKVDTSGNVQANTQLNLKEGQATLDIAKNTKLVDADGKALETISASKLNSLPEPLPPQQALVMAYEFGPDGAQFNPPLTLTLKYDPNSLPPTIDGNKITLAFWDGSGWVNMDSTLDVETNTLIAKINHFSEYALLAELAPPKFTLSDLQISEDKSSPDDPVTIQTVVTNEGGSQGKCTLNLTLNSFGINKKEVILDPGKSETVSFTLKNLLPAKYTVDINGRSSQFTIEVPSGAVAEISPAPEPSVTAAITPMSAPEAKTPAPLPQSKATVPVVWVLLGIIVALALITGIIVIRRKERHS